MRARYQVLGEDYDGHIATLGPSANSCPPWDDMTKLQCVRVLVEQEPKSLTYFDSILEQLPTLIEKWCLAHKQQTLLTTRYELFYGLYNEYVGSQPLDIIFPSLDEIAVADCVVELIEDVPEEEALSAQHFDSFFAGLPTLANEWRADLTQGLLSLLQKHHPDATISDLSLATTIFRCHHSISSDDCGELLSHLDVLRHGCPGISTEDKLAKISLDLARSQTAQTLLTKQRAIN